MNNTADLPSTPRRILALADSDSYLKWSASTLDQLDERFHAGIVIVNSPIAPSADQQAAAVAGTRFASDGDAGAGTGLAGSSDAVQPPAVTTMNRLKSVLEQFRPDVVLLAGTGPVIEVAAEIAQQLNPRPALVAGIPGMALPARKKGLEFRARAHAMILHSAREVREYGALMFELGLEQEKILAHLPFLAQGPHETGALSVGEVGAGGTTMNMNGAETDQFTMGTEYAGLSSVVFTPQALVPARPVQRMQILEALYETAVAHPHVRIIVKVRARAGEQQTHHEAFSYEGLWHEHCATNPQINAAALTFAAGPLTDYLVPGAAHVTVSSTAALESVALGLPTLVLSDFGVNERQLNAVYLGSNLTGTLSQLKKLNFEAPDPHWLEDNYFQAEPSQVAEAFMRLSDLARSHALPSPLPINFKKRRRRLTRNWLRGTLPPHVTLAIGRFRKKSRPLYWIRRISAQRG